MNAKNYQKDHDSAVQEHQTASSIALTMSIGQRIKALRNKKGISQDVLGGLIGVDKSVVSRWENGELTPKPNMVVALADYFEVSEYYLLYGNVLSEGNLLDLNGLTFYQMKLVRELVDQLRKDC